VVPPAAAPPRSRPATALATLGSDTGGSIRQPAALCGVVGFKPTYGLVSRYGLIAYASSLDQIGPFTRTVEDAAIVLGAIAGHDRATRPPSDRNPRLPRRAGHEPRPWRIGIPKEYFGEGLDPEIAAAVEQAIAFYKSQGCEIREVSLPHTQYCLDTYYIIATAEASSNLGALRRHPLRSPFDRRRRMPSISIPSRAPRASAPR
jgi:aspartyl-tRNA(Asn)/glutamyl-tRNA(Gln) amidotransferase subunit A